VSFVIPTTLPGIIAVSIVAVVAFAYIMQVWIHHKCFNYSKELREVVDLGAMVLLLATFAVFAQRDAFGNVSVLTVFMAMLVTLFVSLKVFSRCFFKKFYAKWLSDYNIRKIEAQRSELRGLFHQYGDSAESPAFERERQLVDASINSDCQDELNKAISYFKSKSECFGLKPKA
ncbi:MAG: hypothetical protein VXY83_00390, partial [Pseudomonadota bacterium]|nr:hypothetical protein [Pseudomonadota bacterium]